MRKLLSLLLAAVLLLTLLSGCGSAAPSPAVDDGRARPSNSGSLQVLNGKLCSQSGEPVMLNMTVSKKELQPSEEKPKAVSDIRYNIPGEVNVQVKDSKGKTLIDKAVSVAQFGVSVALPQDLIRRQPHILFNTRTGAILSITE